MTLPTRSLLFVPADSERKLQKSLQAGADALILDLEDSVAPARKPIARGMAAAFLAAPETRASRTAMWVRINPLTTPEALPDLAAIVAGGPAGILLPKAEGPQDVLQLSYYLDALEIREGLPPGRIVIMPVATETPQAPFALAGYQAAKLTRLFGLSWGAEDLSSALGASTNLDADGRWSLTYRVVRSFTLLAAKAAGVQAIETLYSDYRDPEGLRTASLAARREGFTGRFAIHPDQVEAINAAFSPNADDIAFAERVVQAFAEQPDAGTLGIDGKMLDRPHLMQAMQVLAMRDALASR